MIGKPLAGLSVWNLDSRLGARGGQTDANGRYRLLGLPSGELRLEIAGKGIAATTTLTGAPGQTLTWDPVIETGRNVPGRVIGPDGGPFPCIVEGYAPGRRGWHVTEFTDKQGRFTLKNVALDRPLHLTVRKRMFPLVVFDGLPPKEGELLIEVAAENAQSVRLVGRVLDPQGKPVAGATISILRRNHGNSTSIKTGADGAFELGPYPPAEYRVIVSAKGWAKVRSSWRQTRPHETVDLGARGTGAHQPPQPVPAQPSRHGALEGRPAR